MMYTAFNTECDSSSRCSTASPAGDTLGYYPSSAGSYSSMGSPQSQDFTDLSAASASFVPTVTAVSTSPELQWMVQPQLSSSHRAHPYGSSPSPPAYSRTPMRSTASTRRGRVQQILPEEEEKKRVRRERNKQAAAKCRNRRQELTDTLQAETDELEDEKSILQNDIDSLMKEKEKLEFILAAHRPICKIPSELDTATFPVLSMSPVSNEVSTQTLQCSMSAATTATTTNHSTFASASYSLFSSGLALSGSTVKMSDLEEDDTVALEESLELLTKTTAALQTTARSVPEVDLSNSLYATMQDWEPLYTSANSSDFESLCTPVVTCTPSCTTYTSSFAFTYPEAETFPTCGDAHRRGSSSSNDQSSDSLSSPTLLAL